MCPGLSINDIHKGYGVLVQNFFKYFFPCQILFCQIWPPMKFPKMEGGGGRGPGLKFFSKFFCYPSQNFKNIFLPDLGFP